MMAARAELTCSDVEHCSFGCVAFLSICQVLLLHNRRWRGLLCGLV